MQVTTRTVAFRKPYKYTRNVMKIDEVFHNNAKSN